jgi:hypothetical protein
MLISEIKIGMLLNMRGLSDMHCIEPKARVEAVAHDWFVARDEKGQPWFVDYGTWDLWPEQDEETL